MMTAAARTDDRALSNRIATPRLFLNAPYTLYPTPHTQLSNRYPHEPIRPAALFVSGTRWTAGIVYPHAQHVLAGLTERRRRRVIAAADRYATRWRGKRHRS